MPPLYGLIGFPLSHSFSPAYFRKKFADQGIDAIYEAFPLSTIDELLPLIANNPNLCGLNVTIPYKESVIGMLHEIDSVAHTIGAVNCINLKEGIRKGYNTDVIGFEKSLIPLLEPQHTQALVLGTGGSSKAVTWVLRQLGISYSLVSRGGGSADLTYDALSADQVTAHKLIINTTPLGMYPDIESCPAIPYDGVGHGHLLYDLIYNPEETRFLAEGVARGAVAKNGFEMLQLQAEAAWDIWTSAAVPE
jgi:shikimate dehydrogenase